MQAVPQQFGAGIVNQFPMQNVQFNLGQLTIPQSYYPARLLNLQDFSTPALPQPEPLPFDDIQAQQTGLFDCYYYGVNCGENLPSGLGTSVIDAIGGYLKYVGLLGLALILLGFGLFLLAKSTDTGKAAINLATKI